MARPDHTRPGRRASDRADALCSAFRMKTRSRSKPAPKPRPAPAFSLNGGAEISPAASRRLALFGLIVAAAFACGLIFMVAGPHRIGDYMTETDFYGDYARGARLIQHGRLLPSRYGVVGPGYEVTLGLVGFAIRDLFVAAQLVSVAAMTGALLLWFFLLRRRANPRIALGALIVMAFNAHYFHYGYAATTDALAIALEAAAAYLLLARASVRAVTAAGVIAALAFLTRYNAIVLLPAGLIAILAGGTRVESPAGAPPLAARAQLALRFGLAFFAPVVPWVLYSLAHGGSFSFQLHHNIAYEMFARAKGIPWDTYQKDLQPQFKTLWDVIRRDPPAVFSRMGFNSYDHVRLDAESLLGWPVAIVGIIGLAIGVRDGSLRRLWPLWMLWGLLFLTLVPAFHSVRYSLALLPMYAVPVAITFASPLGAFAVGRGRRTWLKLVLAAIPFGLALLHLLSVQKEVIDQLPVEVEDCAATLRELKRPGDRLIARKWHVAFHANVEAVAFPFADSLQDLAAYAHRYGVRWLYMSWPEVETRPQFYYLLDTTSRVPGLITRRATWPHPAVLYEIGPDFGRPPEWIHNDTLVALHTLRARLMVDGNNVHLLNALSTLERARGRLGPARSAANRAVSLAPGDPEAQKTLAAVAIAQGDGAAALEAFKRVAAADPQDTEAQMGIGWALMMLGRSTEAAACWRPLIDATSDPHTLLQMLKLYHATGDRQAEQRAMAALQQLSEAR